MHCVSHTRMSGKLFKLLMLEFVEDIKLNVPFREKVPQGLKWSAQFFSLTSHHKHDSTNSIVLLNHTAV